MNPWFAKTVMLLGSIAVLVIPHTQHRQRSRETTVIEHRKGPLELGLLSLVSLGFLLPLIWIATPILGFADYPLHPVPFIAGVVCLAVGLWLLYLSHAQLGANWSITLEVRGTHRLVTRGLYSRIRHPMYLALLLYSMGQGLVLPNWLAGPCYGVAFVLLVALRLGPEERMMRQQFGKDYEAYMARTKRLVPGVW